MQYFVRNPIVGNTNSSLYKGIVKMDIRYKRLTEKELNTFIHMRINQLREEGAKEEIDLVPALNEHYTRHMADGTFVSSVSYTHLTLPTNRLV